MTTRARLSSMWIVVWLVIAACGSGARPPVAPPPTPTVVAPPAEPALPPGVLARERGLQGAAIEVLERDGLRQLVIDGTVHAAVPIGGGPAPRDAMVGLLRSVRPAAKTALVIGLGSGGTASQLAAAGFDVVAVELEPAVVALARRFFGFRGAAEAGDGLAFVRRDPRTWDVILVDALAPVGLPPAFVEDAAILALRARLTEGTGVLAVRMVETPFSRAANAYLARLGDHRAHVAFGSGIGDEQQNLYLLDSERALSLIADPTLPIWPLVVPGMSGQRVPTSRDVTLVGYLVRVGPARTLCLDLLHWEMGAVRFVLSGPAAAELEKLAGPNESPSSGDIGPDGPIANTLADSLGGAHFKMSDIRYSPTVVALRGTAAFREAIDAGDYERLHSKTAQATRPPLLPYGGVLYDLAVASVDWRLDLATWRTLRRTTLAPAVKRLHAAARAGEMRAAYNASRDYVAALDKALGPWAPRFEVYRHMKWVADFLILDADDRGPAACGRAAESIGKLRRDGYFSNPDVDPLVDLLAACAARRR